MKDKLVVLGLVVGLLVVGLGVDWAATGNDFILYQYFAPKYEQVRRETFEQSRAFNEGMAQELTGMWRDFQHSSDQGEKDAIRSLVQHRVAGYDTSMIQNPQLRLFVQQMTVGN